MNFIKTHWKELVIGLLFILFVSKCSSSGNYERKYKKQFARTEFVLDSINNKYINSAKIIDSLTNIVSQKNIEIENLNTQIEIYKDQNGKLNDANSTLAKKQVVLRVDKK